MNLRTFSSSTALDMLDDAALADEAKVSSLTVEGFPFENEADNGRFHAWFAIMCGEDVMNEPQWSMYAGHSMVYSAAVVNAAKDFMRGELSFEEMRMVGMGIDRHIHKAILYAKGAVAMYAQGAHKGAAYMSKMTAYFMSKCYGYIGPAHTKQVGFARQIITNMLLEDQQ